MSPEVSSAIDEIRQSAAITRLEVFEVGDGGASVIVHDLPLGEQYLPRTGWIGFTIPFSYPFADVYPHYSVVGLARADGAPLGSAFQQTSWRNEPATQISRRSNGWDHTKDTALLKLWKVLEWMTSQ